MKILLAVDGSPISTRAVKFTAALAGQLAKKPAVILFYADPPLMKSVAIELGLDATRNYHVDNGKYAMRAAKQALARAKLDFAEQTVVGDPSESIVKHAKSSKCDLIVMGSHGRGALKGLFLGSVTTKVIAQADIPVTVVR